MWNSIAGLLVGLVLVSAAQAQTPVTPAVPPAAGPPSSAAPQTAPSGPTAVAPSPASPTPASPAAPPQVPPQPAGPRPGTIEAVNRANTELVVTLVRNTLAALGQANQTGNYTVLRDLGAPDFAAKNSATDLAGIFAVLRTTKIDLAPAVLLDPQISRASLTGDQKLYITGALATKPLPVTFELLFAPVNGVWRIDGLSITPVQDLSAPQPAPAALLPKAPGPAPAPASGLKKPKPKHKLAPAKAAAPEPTP